MGAMRFHVCRVRRLSELRTTSGAKPRLTSRSAAQGASRLPRLFSGRAWSSKVGSLHELLACRINTRRFIHQGCPASRFPSRRPLAASVLSGYADKQMTIEATVGVLNVLGDPTRVRLLALLEDASLSVGELTEI